jgi:hypothetical protein
MLVTFHSDAWSSITLFGDVAVRLLKMAGHSGTVPSAIRGSEVAGALARLKQSLAAAGPKADDRHAADADEEGGEQHVALGQRAFPLIQMLTAAAAKRADVTWETGARVTSSA